MRSAGEVRVLGEDPARADEDWRARVGVVLQSWRDHPRWTPRRLLAQLGGYFAPYSTPELPRPYEVDALLEMVGLVRARGPEDRDAVRRSAPATRRRRGDRRPARAAVPRRADRGLRPAGAAGLPRPRPPAVRPRAHDDPAHHARPRRGREARRPHPDPRRGPDRRRRQRRGSWPGRWPARRRCAGRGRARPSCTRPTDATGVRARAARPARRRDRRPRGPPGEPRGHLPRRWCSTTSGRTRGARRAFAEVRRWIPARTRSAWGSAAAGPSSCRACAAHRTRASTSSPAWPCSAICSSAATTRSRAPTCSSRRSRCRASSAH